MVSQVCMSRGCVCCGRSLALVSHGDMGADPLSLCARRYVVWGGARPCGRGSRLVSRWDAGAVRIPGRDAYGSRDMCPGGRICPGSWGMCIRVGAYTQERSWTVGPRPGLYALWCASTVHIQLDVYGPVRVCIPVGMHMAWGGRACVNPDWDAYGMGGVLCVCVSQVDAYGMGLAVRIRRVA